MVGLGSDISSCGEVVLSSYDVVLTRVLCGRGIGDIVMGGPDLVGLVIRVDMDIMWLV